MKISSIPFFKAIVLVGLFALLPACATMSGRSQPPLVVVPYVDYKQYMGTWYEIARFNHSFEKNCVAGTATYRLMQDSKHFEVINRCHEGAVGGPLRESIGKAWVQDPPIQAKLKVQFAGPRVVDYWIVDLAPDYRFAVVSSPERDHLWILSRTPQMKPSDYDSVIANLNTQGFDLSKLQHPPQVKK